MHIYSEWRRQKTSKQGVTATAAAGLVPNVIGVVIKTKIHPRQNPHSFGRRKFQRSPTRYVKRQRDLQPLTRADGQLRAKNKSRLRRKEN